MMKRVVMMGVMIATLVACGGGGGGSKNTRPDQNTGTVLDTRHLSTIKAKPVHDHNLIGTGVTVAVLDSGIRDTHTEFSTTSLLAGKNFVDGYDPDDAADTVGHGTRVASLIGGKNLGVAPGATILPIRITPDDTMTISSAASEDGALYARNQGAKIHNMSFSMGNFSVNQRILNDNGAANVLSVMAAGNSGDANPDPWALLTQGDVNLAAVERSLVVGAVTFDGVSWTSSDKAGVVKDRYLVAPGVGVNTADQTGDSAYSSTSGTSFATPLVSGAAAVVWANDPTLSAKDVADILLWSATDLGDAGVDDIYGHGLLNLEEAMQPLGMLGVPTANHTSKGVTDATLSGLTLSPAFGDALAQSSSLSSVLVLDHFNRPFTVDLRGAVSHSGRQSLLASRIASVDAPNEQVSHDFGSVRLDAGFTAPKQTVLGAAHDERAIEVESKSLATLSIAGQGAGMHYQMMNGGNTVNLMGDTMGGHHWLGETASAMPHLSLLARDNSGASMGSVLGNGWQMQVGYASGRAAPSDSEGVEAGMIAWQKATRDANWTLSLSQLTERGTFLGAASSGALGTGSVAATSSIGMGVNMAMKPGVALFAGGGIGLTRVSAQNGSMLTNWRNLQTSSFSMGLLAANDHREFGVRVMRPLRVDSGKVDLNVPVARTLEHQIVRERTTVDLKPSGQELAVESFYRMAQGKHGMVGMNLMYRIEPNHVRDAAPELATMLEGRLTW